MTGLIGGEGSGFLNAYGRKYDYSVINYVFEYDWVVDQHF